MTVAETAVGGPPLRVSGLVKRFTQGERVVEALRGVSMEVSAGEFVAVMGPSGSGKSTLLHLMAGLDRPTQGSVHVAGQSLGDAGESQLTLIRRRKIGLVFQAYNLIPTLDVARNVALPLALDGRRPDPDRLDALLDRLGLLKRRDHFPDQLSGGEQQRVAIARALVVDPCVLLADEPTGNLDRDSSDAICRLLDELRTEEGCTIVTVTHEPAVACWASSVRVLVDGELLDMQYAPVDHDTAELAAFYRRIVT